MATIIVEGFEILPVSQNIAVFGLGFTGKRLVRTLHSAGHAVTGFSRNSGRRIDLAQFDAATLDLDLDAFFDAAVVTVPPQIIAPGFWTWLDARATRRLLLGTTSIYRRDAPTLTETTPLRLDHDRYDIEQACQATGWEILRLSGLYAADRNPISWIRRGRIGYDARQVNLVHGDDVAEAVAAILAHPVRHQVYNLADGIVHRWSEIIDHLLAFGILDTRPQPSAQPKPDTTVDPGRFMQTFPDVQFRDFWQQLDDDLIPATHA